MYLPPLTEETRHYAEWETRSKLLRDRIESCMADVVCFQEVAPDSFEDDFEFMMDLGYDQCELFKKGRFRPATFWKSARVDLSEVPVHKDRTLLTTFHLIGDEQKRNWHVLNCHLQAGKQGGRRVRQIQEGVSAVTKLAKRIKEPDPLNPLLIVCGDFNGGSESGAVRFIEEGSVGPDFVEDGEPVSSKIKKLTTQYPLIDVMASVKDRKPPATLVVPELISVMVQESSNESSAYEKPVLSDMVKERLKRIYSKFATMEMTASCNEDSCQTKKMCFADVERWLTEINGKVGRGSEFRAAAREMGYVPPIIEEGVHKKPRIVLPTDGILSLESFIQVYQEELTGGKFWGIAHDLHVLGEPLPDRGVFNARYDRMYCSHALTPCQVLDTISSKPCPNMKEPSDHLPVAASFRIKEEKG